MGVTNFPHGISSFGMPVIGSGPLITTGNVWFVDSGAAGKADNSRANQGKSPERPFATLDYAIGRCTADNNDLIIVAAGHSETITGAGGITADVAGVTVVGLGRYDARPTFLMDGAATVTLLVTAANVGFHNLIFKAGHADITVFTTITGKGCVFADCHFEQYTTNENFVTVFSVGAADNDADGLQLLRNVIVQGDTADLHAIKINVNQNDVVLEGNRISGDYDSTPFAPIYMAATEIAKNILVKDNLIHNQHDADAAVGISIANTASTGWIIGNHVGHQDVAGETPILAGAAGLYVGLNYASGVLGTASGYNYPAIDS